MLKVMLDGIECNIFCSERGCGKLARGEARFVVSAKGFPRLHTLHAPPGWRVLYRKPGVLTDSSYRESAKPPYEGFVCFCPDHVPPDALPKTDRPKPGFAPEAAIPPAFRSSRTTLCGEDDRII